MEAGLRPRPWRKAVTVGTATGIRKEVARICVLGPELLGCFLHDQRLAGRDFCQDWRLVPHAARVIGQPGAPLVRHPSIFGPEEAAGSSMLDSCSGTYVIA